MSKSKTEIALGYLRDNPDQWYSPGEIADLIMEQHPDIVREMRETNSRNEKLSYCRAQLASQIGNALRGRSESGDVSKIENPTKFRWKDESAEPPNRASMAQSSSHNLRKSKATSAPKRYARKEEDLYEKLREYLWDLGIGSQRIDERTSANGRERKVDMWRYPDVVGMELLIKRNWESDVKQIVKENADRKARFWSFEAKVELRESNVREAYFQALSNSSWANFGYLVAENVDEPALEQLRLLYSLHGIGVITLNFKNPKLSEITFPARERLNVDWASCNKTATKNGNFRKFIKCALDDMRAEKYSHDMRPKF